MGCFSPGNKSSFFVWAPFHSALRESKEAADSGVGGRATCCLYPSLNWICAMETAMVKSPGKCPQALLPRGLLGMRYYLDELLGRLCKITSAGRVSSRVLGKLPKVVKQ